MFIDLEVLNTLTKSLRIIDLRPVLRPAFCRVWGFSVDFLSIWRLMIFSFNDLRGV